MAVRTVETYLELPYTVEVIRDEADDYSGWFARVVELPGCMTQADSFGELGEMIQDAMRAWIETALEVGQAIPEPRRDEAYSGKFVLRLPRSLHHELSDAAERDGVSLNVFINVALGKALGSQLAIQNDPGPVVAPTWPHISNAARRAMWAAGLSAEANELDEQLFAGWLGNNVQQIEAAVEGGYTSDAMTHLDQVRQALRQCKDNSPLMGAFFDTFCLLEGQVIQNNQLRTGIVKLATVESRIKTQVQTQSQHVMQYSRQRTSYESGDELEVGLSQSIFEEIRNREEK